MEKIVKTVGSKLFFWLIILAFMTQAIWVAFSFCFPLVFDESYHKGVIEIFSSQTLPFIVDQPEIYDKYGDLSHGITTLYHYLMSFPYRAVLFFGGDELALVIAIRIINVLMAALGLVVYSKLLKRSGIQNSIVNLSIMAYVAIPIVPYLAANINYDNMLFLLVALYLVFCQKLIRNSKSLWWNFSMIIIIGCVASLVKYTFLPLFMVSLLFVSVILIKRHRKTLLFDLIESFKKLSTTLAILSVLSTGLFIGLFSSFYVYNVINYGSLLPACEKTVGIERCMKRYVVARRIRAEKTIDERPVKSPLVYFVDWASIMIKSTVTPVSNSDDGRIVSGSPLFATYVMLYAGIILFVIAIIIGWPMIIKNIFQLFLIISSIAMFAAVFIDGYVRHLKYHSMFGIQPRYMLPLLPAAIAIAFFIVNKKLGKRRALKITLLAIFLLLLALGGGIVSYMISGSEQWRW
jgi:hypothetical protein